MGKGGGSSTERISTLTGGQKDALKGLGSFLTPQIGQGADVFGGQRVAGFSPLQQGAADIFGGLTPQIGGALGGGLQGLGQSRESLQSFLGDFDPASSQQAFQTGVADPALRNFQQNIIPGITERFSNSAGSSGVLAQAFAGAGGDLASSLGSTGALFNQNARNTFNQNKLNASGQLAGQSQIGLNFLSALSGLGGQQRDFEQQGLNADFARFQEGQAANNPILNLLPLLLGTSAFENVVTPQGGGLGGALGDLGGAFLGTEAGASGLAGLLKKIPFPSDKRLKENLIKIGTIKKVDFYIWQWNRIAGDQFGKFGTDTGVIAQELMEILPEAVTMEDGYFKVNYDLVMEYIK